MKLDKNFKKIIKYYLKVKENEQDTNNINILEKIVILLSKVDENNLNFNKEYIENIKNYTFDKINDITENMLKKNNKKIDNTIFDYIMKGKLSNITETEDIYNFDIFDENGLTPLHTCIKIGDATILKEFLKKGENIDLIDSNGHTLLEYACLQKDPNMISFLLNHGANMQKHLLFRKNKKYILKLNDIDIALLCRLCLESKNSVKKINLDFLFTYFNKEEEIGLDNIQFNEFKLQLELFISNLSNEKINTLISIWKEELSYDLKNKMGCPINKLEILLLNIVPFIDYPFNITNRNVLTNELIILIKKISLKNNFILDNNFKKELINKIWIDYNNIVSIDYIGIIINNIFSKIKINV